MPVTLTLTAPVAYELVIDPPILQHSLEPTSPPAETSKKPFVVAPETATFTAPVA